MPIITKTTQDWETEIKIALGDRSRTSTELLYKFNNKTLAWLKRHLTRMIKRGEIVEEYEHGKRLYRSVISYPQDPNSYPQHRYTEA